MKNKKLPPLGLVIALALIALNRAFASPSAESMRGVDMVLFIASGILLGIALMISVSIWREKLI